VKGIPTNDITSMIVDYEKVSFSIPYIVAEQASIDVFDLILEKRSCY
jgi:hypothetical protein